jgi:hypothetical protein
MEMANDILYSSYKPYAGYGIYAAAVDKAAAKTNMQRRREMMN